MTTDRAEVWPELSLASWRETYSTLHMLTQIVGKVRLVQSPWVNHSWHVPLYVTARGLTTSPIPHGYRVFQLDFDFIDHRLEIATSSGLRAGIELWGRPVAEFYRHIMDALTALGVHVDIRSKPNEVPDPVPFDQDCLHATYDAASAHRFWLALVQADRVFKQFRSRFLGKCSLVHFFWGSFDLAVTRFSGRPAPLHPGGVPNLPDWVTREAYSHEVSSCGFWPGGDAVPYPLFYSYAYPEPVGFADARVQPTAASYSQELHEWVLPYDVVRQAADPDEVLLRFLQSSYEAAAKLGHWERAQLERAAGPQQPGLHAR